MNDITTQSYQTKKHSHDKNTILKKWHPYIIQSSWLTRNHIHLSSLHYILEITKAKTSIFFRFDKLNSTIYFPCYSHITYALKTDNLNKTKQNKTSERGK